MIIFDKSNSPIRMILCTSPSNLEPIIIIMLHEPDLAYKYIRKIPKDYYKLIPTNDNSRLALIWIYIEK